MIMAKYRILERKTTNGRDEVSFKYSIERRYLGFLWFGAITPTCYNLPVNIKLYIGRGCFSFYTLETCEQHLETYFLNPVKELYKGVLITGRYNNSSFTPDQFVILGPKGYYQSFCYLEQAKAYIDREDTTTQTRVIYK